jgi:hypothetical protein
MQTKLLKNPDFAKKIEAEKISLVLKYKIYLMEIKLLSNDKLLLHMA